MNQGRDTIQLKRAMEIAETGQSFNIAFFTADNKRKKGGEYISLQNVRLKSLTGSGSISHSKPQSHDTESNSDSITKRPNHRANDTRNLIVPGRNGYMKFHPRLMEEFNGKEVIY